MIPAIAAPCAPGTRVFVDGRTPATVRQHHAHGTPSARFPHYVLSDPEGFPVVVSDDRVRHAEAPPTTHATVRFLVDVAIIAWRPTTEAERHAGGPLLLLREFFASAGEQWLVENPDLGSGVRYFSCHGFRCSAPAAVAPVLAEDLDF